MKYPIFYYWVKNVRTKEVTKIVSFDYLGDVNDPYGEEYVITDWTYEELGMEDMM